MRNAFHRNSDKVFFANPNSDGICFWGYVTSATELTDPLVELSKIIFIKLKETWVSKYDELKYLPEEEYRYRTLKDIRLEAMKYIQEKGLSPEKVKISLTAAVIFPDRKNAFWINTGDALVYAEYKDEIQRLNSNKKKLKSAKAQSILSTNLYFEEEAEGKSIRKPERFYLVSKEAKDFFEQGVRGMVKITEENIKVYSTGKKKPIIISEVSDLVLI